MPALPALPELSLFLLAALGLLLVPGPAVLYIVTRSAAHGRKAGFASVLGIEVATLIHSMAAALGLSALLLTSALAFQVVKYAGAAYLVYLGVRTFFSSRDEADLLVPAVAARLDGRESLPRGLLHSFVCCNSKIVVRAQQQHLAPIERDSRSGRAF